VVDPPVDRHYNGCAVGVYPPLVVVANAIVRAEKLPGCTHLTLSRFFECAVLIFAILAFFPAHRATSLVLIQSGTLMDWYERLIQNSALVDWYGGRKGTLTGLVQNSTLVDWYADRTGTSVVLIQNSALVDWYGGRKGTLIVLVPDGRYHGLVQVYSLRRKVLENISQQTYRCCCISPSLRPV
jgi:hypothetical protein